MRALVFTLVMISQLAMAQNLEDVIYKTDGSILRGNLIEQDFTNGRYKIQLQGGSVFSIAQEEIKKITKEAPFSSNTGAAVDISIQNNPTINQSPSLAQTQTSPPSIAATTLGSYTAPLAPSIDNVIYLGFLSHTVSTPDFRLASRNENYERDESYTGLKLAFQANHSKHFATHYAIETAKLKTVEIVDSNSNTVATIDEFESSRYLGLYTSIIASTNLQQGWQFFSGAGLFSHNYFADSSIERYQGARLELGLGYSWQSLQVLLHLGINVSDDYPEEVSSVSGGSLELGFNF